MPLIRDAHGGPAGARLLLAAVAFFTPWGEGLQHVTSFDLSKIFVVLAAALIGYWAVLEKGRVALPRAFTLFFLFVLLHTLVAYGWFFPREFTFGVENGAPLQGGFATVREAPGLVVLRRCLFVVFGYALAALLHDPRRIVPLACGYGAGLVAVLLLGGYRLLDPRVSEVRAAGGFLNPNAFGLAGMTALFLNTLVLARKETRPPGRAIALVFIGAAVAVIFGSGCRGVMAGSLAGLLIVLSAVRGFERKVFFVAGALAVLVAVVNIFPQNIPDGLRRRFDYERIREDGGAGRTYIWKDYLRKFPDYALTGVGIARSMEVTRYSWSYRWAVTHNNYLGVWVEFGAAGMLLFLLALYQLGQGVAWRISLEPAALPAVTVLGLFVAWLVESFFMDTFAQRETWVILGVVAACGYMGFGGQERRGG